MNIILHRNLPAALLAVLAVCAGLSASVLAQTGTASGSVSGRRAQAGQQRSELDMQASKLTGAKVVSPEGEKLGQVEDLVLDLSNGYVRYAVLSFGGAAGLGDKFFAYPLAAFHPAGNDGQLVLDVDKSRLKQAPGFDRDRWPDFNEGSYRSQLDSFFFKPADVQRTPQGARLIRASDVIGKDVNDRAAHGAGKIADLVVNLDNGAIRYAVLNFDKAWSLNNKPVALPLNAFRFPTRPDLDIVLLMDRDTVAKSQPFDEKALQQGGSAQRSSGDSGTQGSGNKGR